MTLSRVLGTWLASWMGNNVTLPVGSFARENVIGSVIFGVFLPSFEAKGKSSNRL